MSEAPELRDPRTIAGLIREITTAVVSAPTPTRMIVNGFTPRSPAISVYPTVVTVTTV